MASRRRPRSPDCDFRPVEPMEILGQGAGGTVMLGTHQRADRRVPCAIKVCPATGNIHDARKEAAILKQVGPHGNILKFFGECKSETTSFSFAVELLQGGDLMDYLVTRDQPLSLNQSQALFAQMAAAVHHLHHCHKVAHLDIKLQNMLLDQSHERLKMCDFGTAQIKGDGNGRWCGELLPHPNPGTEEFAAPEIIERRDIDGFKADLWSLGVCLFTLVTGYPPFELGAHAEPQRESAAAGSVGSFAGSAGSSAGCSTTRTDSSDSAAASHAVTEVVAPRLRVDSTKYDLAYTYEARASNARLSTRAGTRTAHACARFPHKEALSPRPNVTGNSSGITSQRTRTGMACASCSSWTFTGTRSFMISSTTRPASFPSSTA